MPISDTSAFLSIQTLIEEPYSIPWGALAEEIESNGVYRSGQGGEPPRRFGPYSAEAQEALNSLAFALALSRRPLNADFENWYLEEDPTYSFGWPADKRPSFRQTEEYPWFEAFSRAESRARVFETPIVCIGRLLLTRKVTPGHIATVLEVDGVRGFDEFGRPATYGPDSPEVSAIKAKLADYNRCHRINPVEAAGFVGCNEFVEFGWPPETVPDFAAVAAGVTGPSGVAASASDSSPSPSAAVASSSVSAQTARSNNAHHALIGALVEVLLDSAASGDKLPFPNQASLIRHLDDLYGHHNIGLSASTLQRRIPDARQHLRDMIAGRRQGGGR
jgi:hypothetical protein